MKDSISNGTTKRLKLLIAEDIKSTINAVVGLVVIRTCEYQIVRRRAQVNTHPRYPSAAYAWDLSYHAGSGGPSRERGCGWMAGWQDLS